jgi:hypothetical protein
MKTIGLLIVFFALQASAEFETYFSIPVDWVSMDEYAGATTYKHATAFMDFGLSLGARLGTNIGPLQLGLVGEAGWVGNSVNRTVKSGVGTTSWYRVERYNLISGGYLGLMALGKFGIWGEYYPQYTSNVSFSDGGGANPFRHNNMLYGDGYAAGVALSLEKVRISFLIRRLTVRSAASLPVATYPQFNQDDLIISVGMIR